MKRNAAKIVLFHFAVVLAMPEASRGQAEDLPSNPEVVDSPVPTRDASQAFDPEAELDKILPLLRIAEARNQKESKQAFQRVSQVLRAVLRVDPNNARARYYEGRMLVIGGQENMAVSRLQEWIRSPQGVNDWEGHFLLGRIYTRMEFYKLAKPRLEKAIELNPAEAGPFEFLARCETKLADHEGALDAATRFVEALEAKDAMTANAALILADAYILNEQYGKAAKAAQYGQTLAKQTVAEQGGSIPALTMVERCIQKGEEIVQAILEIQPDDPTAHYQMSLLMREQGEVGRQRALHASLAWVFRAIELSGDRPHQDLFVNAGELLIRIGQPEDALKVLNRGRAIHPTDPKINALYDRLAAAIKDANSAPSDAASTGAASDDVLDSPNVIDDLPSPSASVQPPP